METLMKFTEAVVANPMLACARDPAMNAESTSYVDAMRRYPSIQLGKSPHENSTSSLVAHAWVFIGPTAGKELTKTYCIVVGGWVMRTYK